MANKTVPSYTQVPIDASCVRRAEYSALNAAATSYRITVTYQVKDTLGAVRETKLYFQDGVAYPVSGAVIISTLNTIEGT